MFRTGISFANLTFFRLCTGILIVLDICWHKLPYVSLLYTDDGVLPRSLMDADAAGNPFMAIKKFQLFYLLDGQWPVTFAIVAGLIIVALFSLGYLWRITGPLAFVFLWSLQVRNTYVLCGSDEISLIFLGWLLFVNWDKAERNNGIKGLLPIAIFIQIGLLYFLNAINKDGAAWMDGSAVNLVLRGPLFSLNTDVWLKDFPSICWVLTYLTLAWEIVVGFAVFVADRRVRKILAFTLLLFHAGTSLTLNIGFFWMMGVMFFAIIYPFEEHEEISGKEGRGKTIAVAGLLGVILIMNIRHYKIGEKFAAQTPVNYLKHTSMFSQYWSMFAPTPDVHATWFKILGVRNGKVEDVVSGMPITARPERQAAESKFGNVPFVHVVLFQHVGHRKHRHVIIKNWLKHTAMLDESQKYDELLYIVFDKNLQSQGAQEINSQLLFKEKVLR